LWELAYLALSGHRYRSNWSAPNDETLARDRLTAICRARLGLDFSSRIHQELKMNKDQVKGATKEAAGKVQEAAGKQVAGRAQKAYGNAKEAVKDAHK
jgi:uncharacterized protein YjbJ (UPF0337 family)